MNGLLLRLPAALIVAMMIGGCSSLINLDRERDEADLSTIYDRSGTYRGPDRVPVIIVPGILGSRLHNPISGRLIWGAFDGTAADPGDPDQLRAIALPIGKGDERLIELTDDVVPVGVLDRARVNALFLPYELKIYAGIMRALVVGGCIDEELNRAGALKFKSDEFTCFQFPYDWRRDNVDSARNLAGFIEMRSRAVAEQREKRFGIKRRPVKFDIVAHSMGGLLVRYYLMYGAQDLPRDGSLPKLTWEGARNVDKVILVATPNAGSVLALKYLVEGRRFGFLMPHYPPALLGTFPSLAQLLPRSRHQLVLWDGSKARPVQDVLDPDLWKRFGWGLASPRQEQVLAQLIPNVPDAGERRRRALALQSRSLARAKPFRAAIVRPAAPPPHLKIHLVAGDTMDTPKRLSIDSRNGELRILDTGKGDGVVLRQSALLDERMGAEWSPWLRSPIRFQATLFLPFEHIELTSNATFRDNLLYWLLDEPRSALPSGERAPGVFRSRPSRVETVAPKRRWNRGG